MERVTIEMMMKKMKTSKDEIKGGILNDFN